MGQGTESCGGYEVYYDPYDFEESNGNSIWTGENGRKYNVSDMSNPHIESCIKLCERAGLMANFECDSDKWQEWVDIFEYVLVERKRAGVYIPRKPSGVKSIVKNKKRDTWTGGRKTYLLIRKNLRISLVVVKLY